MDTVQKQAQELAEKSKLLQTVALERASNARATTPEELVNSENILKAENARVESNAPLDITSEITKVEKSESEKQELLVPAPQESRDKDAANSESAQDISLTGKDQKDFDSPVTKSDDTTSQTFPNKDQIEIGNYADFVENSGNNDSTPTAVVENKPAEKQDDATVPEANSTNDSSPSDPAKKDDWAPQEPYDISQEAPVPTEVYDPENSHGAEVAPGESYSTDTSWDTGKTLSASRPKTEESDEPKSNQEIIIKGVELSTEIPTKHDKKLDDVVVVNVVDKTRDNHVNVPLSQYNLNYVFAKPDERDVKFSAIIGAPIDPNFLPKSIDLRPTWGSILDQSDLGSCVSNSVAYCVRYCFKKENLGNFDPSRLFIYYNGRKIGGYPINQDTGLSVRDGYKSVAQQSVCSEIKWPYLPNKFSTQPNDDCYKAAREHKTFRYLSLNSDVNQLKKCLKDGYPISFGAALFDSFMTSAVAKTGIVPTPDASKDSRAGGHCMTIVGYDDDKKSFLVCNNWGQNWGIKGFCWIKYDYILNKNLVSDFWSPRFWG